jgi:hypothetical protein
MRKKFNDDPPRRPASPCRTLSAEERAAIERRLRVEGRLRPASATSWRSCVSGKPIQPLHFSWLANADSEDVAILGGVDRHCFIRQRSRKFQRMETCA